MPDPYRCNFNRYRFVFCRLAPPYTGFERIPRDRPRRAAPSAPGGVCQGNLPNP